MVALGTLLSSCETPPEPEPVIEVVEPVVEEEPMPDPPAAEEPAPPDAGWVHIRPDTTVTVPLSEPFIRLVDLRKLRIGMTPEEVLAIFPDPVRIRDRGDDKIWRYEFAELVFRGNRLRDWFNL